MPLSLHFKQLKDVINFKSLQNPLIVLFVLSIIIVSLFYKALKPKQTFQSTNLLW